MDLLTTVVVLLIGVIIAGWLAAARDGRAFDIFGSGFIGYRSYGWPHGVQEEQEIRFSFTRDDDGLSDVPGSNDIEPDIEVIELDRSPESVILRPLR
jgi:hypothetical protein